MKLIIPFLICASIIAYAADDDQRSEIRIPKAVTFLPLPLGTKVRIINGVLEAFKGGHYSPSNLPQSIQELAKAGAAIEIILGSAAIVTDYISIDVRKLNDNNRVPTAAAFIDGEIVAVLERRITLPGGVKVETHFSVFLGDGSFRKISEFKLRENLYNLYLDQAYAISPTLVAIVLRSPRHSYVNAIVLFDISQASAVGYREFSYIQYIPDGQLFWLAGEVPNCDNLAEILEDSEKRASIIPLFKNGRLNGELSETDELENVRGK